ncbi:hypothetical protein BDN72DRAFT_441592 [Pluteus cervinus]|uniref:Uncharacterized protein n=1 Tax=Pluteus cervinus TaxID=181527 RepID=A0ACD3BCZ3_9AGAR|nr:hypothetical protein BDN72DRAFT_441592 [Pluteus cervinus]
MYSETDLTSASPLTSADTHSRRMVYEPIMDREPQLLALNNDDILRQILGHLAVGLEPTQTPIDDLHEKIKSSRKCIYNAVLVSRAFAPPALDLLWQVMDSIKPLIELLPVVVYNDQSDTNRYSIAYESQNLEQSVKHFTRRAEKVQVFYYFPQEASNTDFNWEFFHALKSHPAIPSPLLPNLHTLHVSSLSEDSNHSVLFHILSTSLRFVRVSTWAEAAPDYIRTFITCLLTQARDLHHLKVDEPDEIPKGVQDQLFSFRQLRTLHLTSLNRSIFWPICALDELSNLTTLSMDLTSSQPAVPLDGIRIPCRSVEVLDIVCHISPMFELLAALEAPNLSELCLDFHSDSSERDPHRDASIIGAVAKWSSSLRILSADIIEWDILSVFRDCCWPLVQFEHLHFMEVQAHDDSYVLSEKGCWELARSLPNVEKLSLPLSTTISFQSLLSLTFLCPHLRVLQVGIDTTSSLDVLGATTISFPNELETISVGDTVVADHFLLARSLIISFPDLANIISPSPSWDSVNDLLEFVHSLDVDKPSHKVLSDELSQNFRSRMVRDAKDCKLPEELRLPL